MWDLIVSVLDHCLSFYFIWSVEMCFIFVGQINVIFMRPLYEANILCDCIIKNYKIFIIYFIEDTRMTRN